MHRVSGLNSPEEDMFTRRKAIYTPGEHYAPGERTGTPRGPGRTVTDIH